MEEDPEQVLVGLVARLHSTAEPEPQLIADVGCGDLEDLLRNYEERLWPNVERLAREDLRFRRALRYVAAYRSPAFERRDALLGELGEFWPVHVSFIAYPSDFTDPPNLEWRAVRVEGDVGGVQLPQMLREMADKFERDWSGLPEINYDRPLGEYWLRWWQARWALERGCWEVGVSRDLGPRQQVVERLDALRTAEAEQWAVFRGAFLRGGDEQ